MKLLLVALLPGVILGAELQAAIARNPSVTANLEVSAQIDIAKPVSPGVSVDVNDSQIVLYWNDADKSFISPRFNYNIYLDAASGTVSSTSYKVGVRDVQLNCSTTSGHYHYSGIDQARVTGFGNASVRWQNGADSTISAVGQGGDVKSPAGTMQVRFSQAFGRDVPSASGSIEFQFPLLNRERSDGGADCKGGAILMFYGEL